MKSLTYLTIFLIFIFSSLNANEPFYISTYKVHPGQIRYSNDVVKKKMEEHLQKKEVSWEEQTKSWKLKYFENSSLFPLSKALPVVNSPYGYVLVDGHHHFLTNLKFGGSFIPITVIADYSNLSIHDFHHLAEEKGLIHPYDVYGNRRELPRHFSELINDPNRYFAALCKRKYKSISNYETSKGTDYPIWIKIGKDIPFIEMKISEALWRSGVVFKQLQDLEFYEKARQIITSSEIEGLRVIPERTHYKDIDLLLFSE